MEGNPYVDLRPGDPRLELDEETGVPKATILMVGMDKIGQAISMGHVIPGYTPVDYMTKAAVEHGYYGFLIWGELGTGKSNLALQLSFLFHRRARGVSSDEHAWNLALERLVITGYEFLEWLERLEDEEKRLPLLVLDDVGAYIPSNLFHVDRNLYDALNRKSQLIRALISNLVMTAPLPEKIAPFLREITQFYFITRARQGDLGFYFFERISIVMDWRRNRRRETLILLDARHYPLKPKVRVPPGSRHPRLRFPGVPFWVWEKYWRKRVDAAYQAGRGEGGVYTVSEELLGVVRTLPDYLSAPEYTVAVWKNGNRRVLYLLEVDPESREIVSRRSLYTARNRAEADLLQSIVRLARELRGGPPV